jgi:hypothetical protein
VTACGIDPGREKFGIALAEAPGGGRLIFSAIVPTSEFDAVIDCVAMGDFAPLAGWMTEKNSGSLFFRADCLFIGDGTGAVFFSRKLDEKNIIYNIIDESHTTLEARKLYWKINPPRGLWRMLPLSLMVPPRPVDDLAAWAILKRGLCEGDSIRFLQ